MNCFVDLSKIEAVSLDVWMTLIKSNPRYKPYRARIVCRVLGIELSHQDTVLEIMKVIDRTTDKESDRDGIQYGPQARLQRIADRLQIAVTPFELDLMAGLAQDAVMAFPPLLLENDLLSMLEELRSSGIKLILTSNTGFIDGKAMREAFTANGILQLMHGVVFSNEVGVAKPHKDMFETVVALAGVPADRVLHVGDNLAADYDGALAAGLQACLLSTEPQTGAFTTPSITELVRQFAKSR